MRSRVESFHRHEQLVDLIPTKGLKLLVIPATVFELKRQKIVRDWERDSAVVLELLSEV